MTASESSQTVQATVSREQAYRDWLGIKWPQPSYYALIGVPELEGDPSAIHHAARHVKRKLRAYQIGAYRHLSLDLLGDVGQAVSILTNPEKKRAYDNDLLREWRKAAENLYRVHCEGAPREAETLEKWLTACVAAGVPVTRLLPAIVWFLGEKVNEWAAFGEHQVGLPVNLWIYRDAVILGQCLHIGSLDQRVEAVKNVQKLLGITEGMARIIAEEVSRSLHLFSALRLVTMAKKDSEGLLVRLGRRIRRFGGHLGHRGKVLAAVATLVGKHKKDLEKAFDRLAEPAVELTPGQKAAKARRRAHHRAEVVKATAFGWVNNRPQILLGVGILFGLAALLLAVLVMTGAWTPWKPAAVKPLQDPALAYPEKLPARPAPSTSGTGESPATGPSANPASPNLSPDELQGLQGILQKYQEGVKPPVAPTPPAPAPKPPGRDPTKPDAPATTFFGVPSNGLDETNGKGPGARKSKRPSLLPEGLLPDIESPPPPPEKPAPPAAK